MKVITGTVVDGKIELLAEGAPVEFVDGDDLLGEFLI
jgi:hypothetical protein